MRSLSCLAGCLALALVSTAAWGRGLILEYRFKKTFWRSDSRPAVYPEPAAKIVVDGKMDEPEWARAREHSGFVQLGEDRTEAPTQTSARFLQDDKRLYIGLRCQASGVGDMPKGPMTKANRSRFFSVERVDVYFAMGRKRFKPLKRFTAHAGGGTSYDYNLKKTPAAQWRAAVGRYRGGWTAEMAIRLADLGLTGDEPGKIAPFNIFRKASDDYLGSSLYPGRCDVSRFGLMAIAGSTDPKKRLLSVSAANLGRMRLIQDRWVYDDLSAGAQARVHIPSHRVAPRLVPRIRLRFSIVGRDGRAVASQTIDNVEGEILDAFLDVRPIAPGRYTTRVEAVDAGGQVLARVEHPLIRKRGPAPPPGRGRIPLRLARAGAGRDALPEPTPVTFGAPMPRGASDAATRFRIRLEDGAVVPCQSNVTATWDPKGSARWFLLDTIAPKGLREGARLWLEYGPDVPAAPSKSLQIQETPDAFTVNTGPAKFIISRKSFDLIHQAWYDLNGDGRFGGGESALRSDHPQQGPYVVDQDGKVYWGSLDPDVKVVLERPGRTAAVICARGWHVAKDGSRLCRFVTRLCAYAGKPWLRVFHTFIFTADSARVKLADVALATAVRDMDFEFGAEPRNLKLRVAAAGRSAYLLQYEHDECKLYQSGYPYYRGRRARGWFRSRGCPVALSIGVRDFWQNFPKELEALRYEMRVHLWPAHNPGPDRNQDLTCQLTDDNLSDLWFAHHGRLLDFEVPKWFSDFRGKRKKFRYRYVRASAKSNGLGMSRTHELLYALHPRAASSETDMALLQEPPLLVVSPKWMCDSDAIAPIAARDPNRFSVLEEALERRWDGERAIERRCRDYGMFSFGGAHTYFRHACKDYDRLERPWRLTHHGGPRVPWYMYFRTGRPKYFDRACRNTLHVIDVAYAHHTLPEFLRKRPPSAKILGALNDYKGIVFWNNGARVLDYNAMTDFMLYYYYVTGARRGLEVAQLWGRACRRYFGRPSAGRGAAGTLDATLDLYKATWDPDFRDIAERQATYLISLQQPDGNFRVGHWYTYAPWLTDYYALTRSEDAARAIVRWADGFISNRIRSEAGAISGGGYAHYDVLAEAYRITGDMKYLAHGFGRMSVVANSVNTDRGSALYGAGGYSSHSHGGYFPQTVPYIIRPLSKLRRLPQAIFPPWVYMPGKSADIYVLDETDEPLVLSTVIWRGQPVKIFVDAPGGSRTAGPVLPPVKTPFNAQRPPPRADIAIPRDGKKGCYRIRLQSNRDFSLWLPVTLSRPAKVVYPLRPDHVLGRGSAVYFRVPPDATRVSLAFWGRDTTGHTAALFDPTGRRVASERWWGFEDPGEHHLSVDCPPSQRGKVWLFLQGLSKSMFLRVETKGAPPFFSARPERFFVPPEEARPRK